MHFPRPRGEMTSPAELVRLLALDATARCPRAKAAASRWSADTPCPCPKSHSSCAAVGIWESPTSRLEGILHVPRTSWDLMTKTASALQRPERKWELRSVLASRELRWASCRFLSTKRH